MTPLLADAIAWIKALMAERDEAIDERGKYWATILTLKADNERLRNGIEATLRALNGGMSKSAIASMLDRILGDSHE